MLERGPKVSIAIRHPQAMITAGVRQFFGRRAGAVVATLRGAVVRRGDFTLGPVDLQIDWADRIALTNGLDEGIMALSVSYLRPPAGNPLPTMRSTAASV